MWKYIWTSQLWCKSSKFIKRRIPYLMEGCNKSSLYHGSFCCSIHVTPLSSFATKNSVTSSGKCLSRFGKMNIHTFYKFDEKASTEQKIMKGKKIHEKIKNLPRKTSIAFTDGSCLSESGEYGPCGGGAFIIPASGTKTVQLENPVSSIGSNLLGELNGVKLALDYFSSLDNRRNTDLLVIFTDCYDAIKLLYSKRLKKEDYAELEYDTAQSLKSQIQNLKTEGFKIRLEHVPSHGHILGNYVADNLARLAAVKAKEGKYKPVESVKISDADIEKWQKENLRKILR